VGDLVKTQGCVMSRDFRKSPTKLISKINFLSLAAEVRQKGAPPSKVKDIIAAYLDDREADEFEFIF
jgi:hypothetical protein